MVPLLNPQETKGATIKALEERITKLRRKARDELAAMDLLPSDEPVSSSGLRIPIGRTGPYDFGPHSTSTDIPLDFHYSSGQLLPEDFETSLTDPPTRTSELSPRKRRANKNAVDDITAGMATHSPSGSRKRGRVSITAQRAAEKARMFGGAVDDEDEAFAEARLKRVKKQDEEDDDDLMEISMAEMAVVERHRRPYGVSRDTKAGKDVVLRTTPQKLDASEVVEEVKEEENQADTPVGDPEFVDLGAVKAGTVKEEEKKARKPVVDRETVDLDAVTKEPVLETKMDI